MRVSSFASRDVYRTLCALAVACVMQMGRMPIAAADVYKCVGSDGVTSYSQTPCGSSAERVTVEKTPAPVVAGPQISRALYTSPRNGRSLDVTSQLQSQCAATPGACRVSCGNHLAGDPDFGQRKYCRISYLCGGTRAQELQIQEGETSSLSCPSPAARSTTATPTRPGAAASPAATASSQSAPPAMKPGMWLIDQGDRSAVNSSLPDMALRMCLTPEMLSRGQSPAKPPLDSASCSTSVSRGRGTATLFQAHCADHGRQVSETIEATADGNSIVLTLEAPPSAGGGATIPALHSVTRMRYLGPDCRASYAVKEETPSRRLRYEASFSADGKQYQLHADYECRYESHPDPTSGGFADTRAWIPQGGPEALLLRLVAKLPDGEPLMVSPKNLHLQPWSSDTGACPQNTVHVRSQIVAALGPDASIRERFDEQHVDFTGHRVALVDSHIVPLTSAAEPPASQAAAASSAAGTKPYYSVEAIVVPLASLSGQEGLKEFVLQKHVAWLASGQTYVFREWTDDQVQFARKYAGVFTTEDDFRGKLDQISAGLRVYGASRDDNGWKIERERSQLASQWIPSPPKNAADQLRVDVPAITKTWVSYGGARIEVGVFGYFRVLYDPARDELIEFTAEELSF